jgi:integrase
MARPQKLTRRDGTYYVRIHVPADLVAAMGGKREFWRSLRTKEYPEAQRRALPERDQWSLTFYDMRRRRDLSGDDIAAAVWEHYATGLDANDKERLTKPSPADIDAARHKAVAAAMVVSSEGNIAITNALTDFNIMAGRNGWAVRRRAARLNRLRNDLATGDTRLIEPGVDAFLSKRGFKIEHRGLKYRELCAKMMRAEIEQLERTAERDAGDFTGRPADPIVKEPVIALAPPGSEEDGIMALFAQYEKENPNNVRPETFYQIRTAVQHFADFAGPRIRATKITKAEVRDWKVLLGLWPVKAAEVKTWKGLSAREIITDNARGAPPKPTISRATLRRYMGNLSGYCEWLTSNDYLPANPVSGLLPGKAPPTNRRATFTDAQLKTLFTSPLFTTCLSAEWRDVVKVGNVAVRDHRYWIPLVMAYSGARPAEIAQLHVGDVRRRHGVWVMHITEENGENKRTKTESSMREVPIHSELIQLGFVRHCEASAARGEGQVFPEVKIPKEGQIAAQFSREFNRYLGKVGVKTGKNIVTYSLRHTFVDRARRTFMNEEIATVVGHDKATQTGKYGTEKEGTLKRRSEIVEAVTYQLA